MTNNTGIYKIENKITGDCYIGQSVHIHKRIRSHIWELKHNSHGNPKLQNAFNKYGKNQFMFSVVLYCEQPDLTYYEQKLVDLSHSVYNTRECVDSNKGIKRTIEIRKTQSARMMGNKHRLGTLTSEEARKRMSVAHIGNTVSDDVKSRLSNRMMGNTIMTGRCLSDETKKKISDSSKGRRHTENVKNRISKSLTGHLVSEETRNKISISRKLWFSNNRKNKE